MEIENGRIMATLTVGEYRELMSEMGSVKPKEEDKEKTYVFGIEGIMKLFGVCRSTAQTYKATFLKDAIEQHGRKIVTDVDKARVLFKARKYDFEEE